MLEHLDYPPPPTSPLTVDTKDAEQEGDPSLPAVLSKEVSYIAAKPLIPIMHRRRKCITNIEEYNKTKVNPNTQHAYDIDNIAAQHLSSSPEDGGGAASSSSGRAAPTLSHERCSAFDDPEAFFEFESEDSAT